MSDISIPGVNGKYNTKEMVANLVKLERTKLDTITDAIKSLEDEKKTWQEVNRLLSTLRTSARSMYNYENPFAERSAESSSAALSASAERDAPEGTNRIEILRLAQADRYASDSITKDYQVAEGTYSFTLGEDEKVSLRFRGGSISDFITSLNRRADGLLKGSLVQNKPGTWIFILESQKTGASWPLKLEGDAEKLGLSIGMIKESKDASFTSPLDAKSLKGLDNTSAISGINYTIQDDTLTVKAGSKLEVDLSDHPPLNQNSVLTYEVRVISHPESERPQAVPPSGPQIPQGPGASLKDVSLPDIAPSAPLPEWKEPEQAPPTVDDHFLWLSNGSTKKEAPSPQGDTFQKVEIPIGKDFPSLSSLLITNNNTLRDLEIKNIQISDPTSRGNYAPANALSKAQNALIKIDGIEYERETNTVEDAIPSVTLNLNNTSDSPITLTIGPDRDLVKNKIIEFVAQYNSVIRDINILTSRKGTTEIVDELEFLKDDEREEAIKKIGLFQGDSTLNMMKTRLQNILANAYRPGKAEDLILLNNAGISTNAGQAGGGIQTTKLRGYLEINEKTLDKVMAENFLALKDIFGYDSNGDLLSDKGVGVELDSYIQPYIQTGGLLASKSSYYDTRIQDKNKEKDRFEDYLVTYETQLKQKYGNMEGTLNQLNNSAKDLNSLNQNSDN